MYKAKNGFILKDNTAPGGWKIEHAADIVSALQEFPHFKTIADGFIWKALESAISERKEFDNITDLAFILNTLYL